MSQRLEYIDIAKGFGIILVVLSHTEHPELMYYTSAFFVPIFFFCSGYTSNKKDISLVTYFQKQATKLLKPYLFFSALLLLYFHDFSLRAIGGIIYSRYCLYPFNSGTDICHFMIIGNYPMWFLTCMVIAFLLYDLLIYNLKNCHYLIFLYLTISIFMNYLPILLPWSIDTAPLMAVIMFCGKLYRQYLSDFFSRKKPLIFVLIIIYLVLLPCCDQINVSVREYGLSVITYLLSALAGSIILINLSKSLQGTVFGKGLQQIGIHSLTIFCIEIPFILIGKQLAEIILPEITYLQTAIITSSIQLIITLVGGLLLSILLHRNEKLRKIVY